MCIRDRAYVALERRDDGRLHQVAFDRFNQQDWNLQISRTASNCGQYPYRNGCMDVTGLGDVVDAMLQNSRTSFVPINFSTHKQALVNELSAALDNDELRLYDHPILRDELRRFTYRIGSTGNYQYSAPTGYHDDVVMALALAVYASRKHKPTDPVARRELVRSVAF